MSEWGQETREIQKKLKVHLFVSVDGWEEACDQVLVERLVLAHLVDGVPLLRRHPLLDRLRRVFHLRIVAIHLLVRGHSCASLKKIQRSLGLRYKELLRIIDKSFHVGILLCEMSVLVEYSLSFWRGKDHVLFWPLYPAWLTSKESVASQHAVHSFFKKPSQKQ